ncbi:MAG: thioredoxin domain-containing protein [Pseudomonadota bacterium]
MRTKALLLALTLALSAPVAAMAQTAPDTAPAAAPTASSIAALRPDDRIVGSMDAPVTLTTYLSTTCGHCANWHNTILPTLMAKYVETGQVRIVYRDLPTPPQDVAGAGAVMARCVPADKFDAALDSLYRDQGILRAANEEEMHRNAMVWLAGAGAVGGLTPEQMNTCFDDEANWNALEARVDASRADGVTGTPTFFVNGVLADIDSRDLAAFDAAIQPQLTAH